MTLTQRILVAMGLAIVVGSALNVLQSTGASGALRGPLDQFLIDGLLDVVSQVFVASLRLLVVPLVFVSLVCGASALGNNARMGPIAAKTIGFYLFTTAIAVTSALAVAVLVGPGEGVSLETDATFTPDEAPPLKEVLINIFPSNPVRAMAEGEMLQIIVFALLVGYALTRAGDAGERLQAFFRDLETLVMRMVSLLMGLAPYGVFALLASLFARLGFAAIVDLAAYFATVLAILIAHALLTYSLLLRALVGLNPVVLWRKLRPVWAFAFSTASSGATLPVTLHTVERRLGVRNSVAGFTVPLGATVNMDGTAIMQGVATVFIAEAYGFELSAAAYLTVILTATLASIGTAAVPGVGLITLATVLGQVGLPVEGIALIIGVDRLLDMVRTAVNVTGDVTAAVVVGHSEGQLDRTILDDPEAGTDSGPDPATPSPTAGVP